MSNQKKRSPAALHFSPRRKKAKSATFNSRVLSFLFSSKSSEVSVEKRQIGDFHLLTPLLSLLLQEVQKVFFSFLDTVATKQSVEVMACESQECYNTNACSSTPPPTPLSAYPSPQWNPKECDQCFLCKRFGHWAKDCPNKSPQKSESSSPGSSSSPSVPKECDRCFLCKRFGHWAKDCPNKNPKKSESSSPGSSSSPSVHVPDLPMVRCPCGQGICKVITSRTDKNPGRKFYACPVDKAKSGKCEFFKWTDVIAARFKPPTCPCGVGRCSLNIVSSGPDRDRWYFACRIKKNHGACQFFQWADSEVNSMLIMRVDESKGHSSPRSLFTDHQVLVNNEPRKEDDQSSDIKLESAIFESFDNFPNSSLASPFRKDEIPVTDMVLQDSESWDLVAGTSLQLPPLIPKSEILCQESEFSLQISAAGQTTREGSTPSFDPVIEDLGDIEGPTLLSDRSSNDEESVIPHDPLPQSPGKDVEHPNSVFQEPSGIKIVVQKNDISKSALKTFGQGLLDTLQSMDQTQHERMLKVAEAIFDALRHLSIDNASFSKAVMEYIHCKSKLSGIEESMGEAFSSEQFLGHYNEKKTQFDNISQLHAEAVSAYEASENRLQSLRGEVSRVKDVLLQLEKQLPFCEAEILRCESHFVEISKDKSESERNLDAACEKMEEALKLEHERDSMVDAANAALENARVQLLH
ncbi:unnamed protein product [Dovyalis caffra]|uniref:Zinc finger GRF-type domain-containing protein n=1 Tax=Dovyalis caffra TaxID=77055 RepID=A0AAV1R8G1_9ROSI|nr:unnamed protein product [Dovyalis caffra]